MMDRYTGSHSMDLRNSDKGTTFYRLTNGPTNVLGTFHESYMGHEAFMIKYNTVQGKLLSIAVIVTNIDY